MGGRRGHNNIADDHLVTHSLELDRQQLLPLPSLPLQPDVFHAAFTSFENESVVFLTVQYRLYGVSPFCRFEAVCVKHGGRRVEMIKDSH